MDAKDTQKEVKQDLLLLEHSSNWNITRINGGLANLMAPMYVGGPSLLDALRPDSNEKAEDTNQDDAVDCDELKARPITAAYTEFTPEQFAIRLEKAKEICKTFLEDDETLTADMKEIYEKYPMWGFYTYKEGHGALRSFGVAVDEDNKWRLHTQVAHMLFDNVTLGGTPVDDLVRVDQWSPETIRFLKQTSNPGCYIDPLGFMVILNDHAK